MSETGWFSRSWEGEEGRVTLWVFRNGTKIYKIRTKVIVGGWGVDIHYGNSF